MPSETTVALLHCCRSCLTWSEHYSTVRHDGLSGTTHSATLESWACCCGSRRESDRPGDREFRCPTTGAKVVRPVAPSRSAGNARSWGRASPNWGTVPLPPRPAATSYSESPHATVPVGSPGRVSTEVPRPAIILAGAPSPDPKPIGLGGHGNRGCESCSLLLISVMGRYRRVRYDAEPTPWIPARQYLLPQHLPVPDRSDPQGLKRNSSGAY